eukprot:gene32036-16564_t
MGPSSFKDCASIAPFTPNSLHTKICHIPSSLLPDGEHPSYAAKAGAASAPVSYVGTPRTDYYHQHVHAKSVQSTPLEERGIKLGANPLFRMYEPNGVNKGSHDLAGSESESEQHHFSPPLAGIASLDQPGSYHMGGFDSNGHSERTTADPTEESSSHDLSSTLERVPSCTSKSESGLEHGVDPDDSHGLLEQQLAEMNERLQLLEKENKELRAPSPFACVLRSEQGAAVASGVRSEQEAAVASGEQSEQGAAVASGVRSEQGAAVASGEQSEHGAAVASGV